MAGSSGNRVIGVGSMSISREMHGVIARRILRIAREIAASGEFAAKSVAGRRHVRGI